jgi:hypothetical protein
MSLILNPWSWLPEECNRPEEPPLYIHASEGSELWRIPRVARESPRPVTPAAFPGQELYGLIPGGRAALLQLRAVARSGVQTDEEILAAARGVLRAERRRGHVTVDARGATAGKQQPA